MATLVLTAVGSAIGGPVGGAIGAAIGQQIDQVVFAPKPREGARLKELEVQTSSYGSQIPAIFGAMRVAGTVIWATDLVERRSKSGGGKGRPATINYSYSVSMAVALSSRPVARIGRIWADGNLLRGGAGDLKVDTQLRLYTGHDDQPLDPLMASAENAGQCPAHRGLAYAIFEDLQLADYGNRIPSLTFELFEREAPVPVAAIFDAATGGEVTGPTGQVVRGFALSGQSAKEPLSLLLDILPVELVAGEDGLTVRDPVWPSGDVAAIVPVVAENREKFDPPLQTLDSANQIPHSLALRYYDAERDFQAGVQRSERGAFSRNAVQIELPAVLTPLQAKQLVDHRHLHLQGRRAHWRGEVAHGAKRFRPGDCIADGSGRKWQIEQIEHRMGSASIVAGSAVGPLAPTGTIAIPGRNVPAPDLTIGETRIVVIDLPIFGNDDPGKPLVAIFAAGTGAAWRRAALSLRVGDTLEDIGTTAMPAIMGASVDALSPHNPLLIDERGGFRVQLLNEAMELAERVGSPLDFDAPYIWLAGEFLRYGNCEALGDNVYRLSRLQRNCFRSGNTVPHHVVGSRIVLIQAEAARLIEERNFVRGDRVEAEALGLGDSNAASASVLVDALAITPLAPVHGSATAHADGSVLLRWVRRARMDSGWRDGVDQAMVEGQEQYVIRLSADGAFVGEWTTAEPHLFYGPAQWAALALAGNAAVTFAVRQVGRHAQSDPLTINLI
jgi:hypothetical protein